MKYDFDQIIERTGTDSFKWDCLAEIFGTPDVLPMWVADMDFLVPTPVIQALQKRAAHGIYGYNTVPPSTYEAVAHWMRTRHKWDIQTDWLTFLPGVVPGVNFAIHAFTSPGDNVLIQPPVYHPFFSAITNNGRHEILNQLVLNGEQYVMDFEDLSIKMHRDVEMAIFCSPHNPVGRVWGRDELLRFGQACIENKAVIVSDEIHADLSYKPHQHIPLASLSEEFAQNSVTLIAPSKTFNLAGLASSVAIIPNQWLRRRFRKAMDQAGIHLVNTFGTIALEAGYRHGADWLDQLLEYLQGNLDYLIQFFATELPSIKPIRPEGTYMVWLDCRGLGLEGEALKRFMIERARVGLNDGQMFGPGGHGFQRINIACPRALLVEGLNRIKNAVDKR